MSDRSSRASDWKVLKRLTKLLWPHKVLVGTGFVFVPLGLSVELASPLLIKKAIEVTIASQDVQRLFEIALWFAAVIAIGFVGRFGQAYCMQLAGQRTTAALRGRAFEHLERLPLSCFDRTPVGRLVTTLTADVTALANFFATTLLNTVTTVITLVGILALMFLLDVRLTLVSLVVLPPFLLLVVLARRGWRKSLSESRTLLADLNAFLHEQLQGLAVVQAFRREKRFARGYHKLNDAHRKARNRAIYFEHVLNAVVQSAGPISIALVLWFATVELSVSTAETATARYIGTVVAFYIYLSLFFGPIQLLLGSYASAQSALASAERVFSLLDTPPEPETRTPSPAKKLTSVSKSDSSSPLIEFDRVTFGYNASHPVLHDVRFSVSEGDKVALVGATGAGKSSTVSLLLRLYEGFDGSIRFEGKDIRSLPRRELRDSFAVVPQDPFLFRGPVAENIAFGSQFDPARARHVLEQVGAWGLVAARGGLEAQVDARGANFSSGEQQLLAFARALYRGSRVLVLDEATANVDSASEQVIQQATARALEGRTALIIAHRLSTIQHCNRVLVFRKGELVEQGTPEELLRTGELYPKLHALHFNVEQGDVPYRSSAVSQHP